MVVLLLSGIQEGYIMKHNEVISFIIELAGIILIGAGIVIELIYKAQIGFILITTGALVTAIGALIYAKKLQSIRSKP